MGHEAVPPQYELSFIQLCAENGSSDRHILVKYHSFNTKFKNLCSKADRTADQIWGWLRHSNQIKLINQELLQIAKKNKQRGIFSRTFLPVFIFIFACLFFDF